MLGSHIGVWLGPSQPSIPAHLLAATNIVAKANVGGPAERNNLRNVVTGNFQCWTSWQCFMIDLLIEAGWSHVELSHFSCLYMIIWFLMNGQLNPYFIKLIAQSPTG